MARFSQALVAFAERWFPDAYVFVLIAVIAVAAGAILHGGSPLAVSRAFGDGFWNLIPFTMQMALVAIGGYVVAMSPPVAAVLARLASVPKTGRGAVVFVGVLSIVFSLLNWGLSLIFSGLLVREIARRTDIRLDYRAAGAAGYLGLGCGFTLGITSSAAQLQANAGSIPASLLPITGVIGFSETILTWQNMVTVVMVTVVSAAIGFGAQTLVQDLITGLFLLIENTVQVGDTVTVSGLSGVVENVSIRTMRLRAGDGSVHVVPFSAVTTITNASRGAGNAAVSVNVSYKEDTDRAGEVLKDIVAGMRQETTYRALIRGDLELWGVDKVDGSVVTIVGQIRCTDGGRWSVQREFNRRMKRRFQEEGIEIASMGQTILMQIPAPSEPDTNTMPRRAAG